MPICNLRQLFVASAVGLTALVLAGCNMGDTGSVSRLNPAAMPEGVAAPSRVFRDPGGVVLEAPRGYCVSPNDSRAERRGSFVLMAGCPALGVASAREPAIDGVLTITLASDRDSVDFTGSEKELAAVLSKGGDMVGGDVLRLVEADKGRITLVVREVNGPGPIKWRSFAMLSGRLATVSLRSYADHPMDEAAGLRLLDSALDRFMADNPPLPVADVTARARFAPDREALR